MEMKSAAANSSHSDATWPFCPSVHCSVCHGVIRLFLFCLSFYSLLAHLQTVANYTFALFPFLFFFFFSRLHDSKFSKRAANLVPFFLFSCWSRLWSYRHSIVRAANVIAYTSLRTVFPRCTSRSDHFLCRTVVQAVRSFVRWDRRLFRSKRRSVKTQPTSANIRRLAVAASLQPKNP